MFGRLPLLFFLEEHCFCFLVKQITVVIKVQFKVSVIMILSMS